VSRKKTKGKGAAKKSRKSTKKNDSSKKSEKKPAEKQTAKLAEMPAKEPTKKDEGSDAKKPMDMAQARENVNDLVRESAAAIATGVINTAKSGQLASAKYLFEAAGLYPATGQTIERPVEDSLAYTLLRRMGLPLEPVVADDDDVSVVSVRDTRGSGNESAGPSVEREDARADCEDEQSLVEDAVE